MKAIDSSHKYEYDPLEGTIRDCTGEKMDNADDYVDEMNMLMDNIRVLEEALKKSQKKNADLGWEVEALRDPFA